MLLTAANSTGHGRLGLTIVVGFALALALGALQFRTPAKRWLQHLLSGLCWLGVVEIIVWYFFPSEFAWAGVVTAVVMLMFFALEYQHFRLVVLMWHRLRAFLRTAPEYVPGIHFDRPARGRWSRSGSEHTDELPPAPSPKATPAPELPTPAEALDSWMKKEEIPQPTRERMREKHAEYEEEIAEDKTAAAVRKLISEGVALRDVLLAARRQPSPFLGASNAMTAVAGQVAHWNSAVADLVDNSQLSFREKLSLKMYQRPVMSIMAPTAEHLGEIIENNLALLARISR